MDTATNSVMVAVKGVIAWEGVEVWNWGFCWGLRTTVVGEMKKHMEGQEVVVRSLECVCVYVGVGGRCGKGDSHGGEWVSHVGIKCIE